MKNTAEQKILKTIYMVERAISAPPNMKQLAIISGYKRQRIKEICKQLSDKGLVKPGQGQPSIMVAITKKGEKLIHS